MIVFQSDSERSFSRGKTEPSLTQACLAFLMSSILRTKTSPVRVTVPDWLHRKICARSESPLHKSINPFIHSSLRSSVPTFLLLLLDCRKSGSAAVKCIPQEVFNVLDRPFELVDEVLAGWVRGILGLL